MGEARPEHAKDMLHAAPDHRPTQLSRRSWGSNGRGLASANRHSARAHFGLIALPVCTKLEILINLADLTGSGIGVGMIDQRSFFGLAEHLEVLSERGVRLEVLDATFDFGHLRDRLS